METAIITVKGMESEHCVGVVNEAVCFLPGINTVSISLDANTATVVYDPAQISVELIKAAIIESGYEAI
ncbi:MAG: cation transporter [Coriobacteriia bacterium]|nr:cation transporter [Coriobacteriia bacterium]